MMLTVVAIVVIGCHKPDEPNNGGNDVPETPIIGLFSINDSTQVCFSPGNLQYQASTDTWRFAENQWDYVGENNANISETYDGWIDLFGWGRGDDPTYTGNSWDSVYWSFADWGMNPISNGSDYQWRTLNLSEWLYLLFRDTDSGIRCALATVNSVKGLILLPDNWDASVYTFVGFNNSESTFDSNIISASQWETLERNGAVFLPASGIRIGTMISYIQEYGMYWIAGKSDPFSYVFYVQLCDGYLGTPNYCERNMGLSVRLVRDAE